MPHPWKHDETVYADISPCGRYRYYLLVHWAPGKMLVVVGLNPSVACVENDDATVRKCINWARRNGYCGLLMLNAYSFRATDPKEMMAADDPFGEQTVEALVKLCGNNRVVAAWGGGAKHRDRANALIVGFRNSGIELECWGVNKDSSPIHPCYARLGELTRWRPEGLPR